MDIDHVVTMVGEMTQIQPPTLPPPPLHHHHRHERPWILLKINSICSIARTARMVPYLPSKITSTRTLTLTLAITILGTIHRQIVAGVAVAGRSGKNGAKPEETVQRRLPLMRLPPRVEVAEKNASLGPFPYSSTDTLSCQEH